MKNLTLVYQISYYRKIRQARFRLFFETNFLEFTLRERVPQMSLKDHGLSDHEHRLSYTTQAVLAATIAKTPWPVVCLCVLFILPASKQQRAFDKGFLYIS
jgi:hypothetical protein